jgi:hypothetical protein
MKSLVGAVAVLFLVTTFAVAGAYQPSPFPQEANTALNSGNTGSATGEMPASMAASQGSEIGVATSPAEAGSPFPSVANPSAGADLSDQTTPSSAIQLGSPFPAAARP